MRLTHPKSLSLTHRQGSFELHPDARPAPTVLHVRVVAGTGGGPDKTILRSAAHADPARLRVAAAYIHPAGDPGIDVLREHAHRLGCPFYEIPEAGACDLRTIGALLHLCHKLGVTVWHGHDYKSDLLGLLVRRLRPMRLATTLHGFTRETPRTRLYYHVDNWCLPRYEQVMAVSPQLVDHCREMGVDPARIDYIPNAIDTAEYRRTQDTPAAKAALGISTQALVIGVVGRLSPEKGVDRSIHALASLRRHHPAAELHLVGDGPERAALESLTRQLNLSDAVHFHGWQKQSARFYEAMDMLLLPSYTEGLPNVVLEAMAMNVPVAATDVGGVRELLDNGRCGVVLSQIDLIWSREIAPLLVSSHRRAELARRAHRRVEEHYSFTNRMTRELAVYDRMLHLPPTPERRAAA